jgi:hypothetical protein
VGKHGPSAKWLVGQFCYKEVFREFLLGEAPSAVRLATVGLLLNAALCKVYEDEKRLIGPAADGNDKSLLVVQFVNFTLGLLPECRIYKSYGGSTCSCCQGL